MGEIKDKKTTQEALGVAQTWRDESSYSIARVVMNQIGLRFQAE